MKSNSLWLERGLIIGPYLALVQSEKEFLQAMSDCGISASDAGSWQASSHADATMHSLENTKGDLCCIVTLGPVAGRSGVEIAGILVHEAVHVWQKFRERIGEKSPSSEFEAYSIQVISQQLMWAYTESLTK